MCPLGADRSRTILSRAERTTHDNRQKSDGAGIGEDPDRASEFGGVGKFVLDGDEGRTFILNPTDQPRVSTVTVSRSAPSVWRFHRSVRRTGRPARVVLHGKAERRG
jgi:hypothetical protein